MRTNKLDYPVDTTGKENHKSQEDTRMSHAANELPQQKQTPVKKEAYVTLLYSDDFLLGVRVLRQSLVETNTEREFVILCTEKVSSHVKDILSLDGWIVKSVTTIDNPYEGASRYFKDIMTKLHIWRLTEYYRVVYLDADTLALQNIDCMFRCGNFCMIYRHADHFNGGVLVVSPSEHVYQTMTRNFLAYGSYESGDQGFLNAYFSQLKYVAMFNPKDPTVNLNPMRLPAGFNGDVGLYYLNSGWQLPRDDLYIIHFTPFKPWKWYYYPLFDLCFEWNAVRNRLRIHHMEPTITSTECLLPLLMISATLLFFWKFWSPLHATNRFQTFFAPFICKIGGVFPLLSLIGSYSIAFLLVPTMLPYIQGWLLFVTWVVVWNGVFYHTYCEMTSLSQKHNESVVSNGLPTMGEHKHEVQIKVRMHRKAAKTLLWLITYVFVFHFAKFLILYQAAKFGDRYVCVCVCVCVCVTVCVYCAHWML